LNPQHSVDEAEGTATVLCRISQSVGTYPLKNHILKCGPYLLHETKVVSACIPRFRLFAEQRSRRSCRTLTALFSVQKQVVQNPSIMELHELFHFQIAFHLTYVLDYRQEAICQAYSPLINVRTDLHANYPSGMMSWLCKGVFYTILPFSLSLVQSHLLFICTFLF